MKKVILTMMIAVLSITSYAANDTAKVIPCDSLVDVLYDSIWKLQDTVKHHANMLNLIKGSTEEHLWGGMEPIFYFWWEFWALIGIFLWWGYKTFKGVKAASNGTPTSFSLKYWWDNNKMKIYHAFWVLIFIFICGRFCFELFGFKPSDYFAIVLGVSLQYIIEYVFAKIDKSKPTI